jgi:serine phosphatase RsbU (regulator of sigma subunit)
MADSLDILSARILIVDDKPDNIHLLEGMLRVAGYTAVESTSDPLQVCNLHRLNRYSLIMLDLQMPVMDGFQVIENLREIEADDYLPVLVVSAQPSHKLRALQAGAKDFVGKPFDMAEFRARVHNILEVRLLHDAAKRYSAELEQTVRELQTARELLRIKTLAEQEKAEWELDQARQTQESLLPRVLPHFENYVLNAYNSPTRYVGGDFYDFLSLDSGQWMGVVADVSGKGIAAALLSSMVLGALNMEFRMGTPAPEVLRRLNLILCEKSLPVQYITLFLFLLMPDGSGEFFSAGHNPAYLFRAATAKVQRLFPEDFVIGMFEVATYNSRILQMDGGDILLVCSDGLIDAENNAGEMFGHLRFVEIFQNTAPRGGNAVRQDILQALQLFTEGAPQNDDTTFVVVEKLAGPRETRNS